MVMRIGTLFSDGSITIESDLWPRAHQANEAKRVADEWNKGNDPKHGIARAVYIEVSAEVKEIE